MTFIEDIVSFLGDPLLRAGAILLMFFLLAIVMDRVVHRAVARFAARTRTDLDDKLVAILRRPMSITILLAGVWSALRSLHGPGSVEDLAKALCLSVIIIFWTVALTRVGSVMLHAASLLPGSPVQRQTMPVFEMGNKVVVIGMGFYFLFDAWDIDITAWVAGAGITGIVIGLAAQDTLSNLFAGIFILADAPYKLGDFLTLGDGTRGRVTHIGLRSTRILTNQSIEIIIPNAELASSRITNESGGPSTPARVDVVVGVAYGVDIDRVRRVLLEEARAVEGLAEGEAFRPRAFFFNFGESSLDFRVVVYPANPADKEPIIDAMHTRIYKRLNAEGIEIPYSKHDVYLYKTGGDE